MNNIDSSFSFKLVDQDQVFKEIKKLDGIKASQKNDIPMKIMKKNINIVSYILFHNFNNPLFDFVFPSKLNKWTLHPFIKRKRNI